jgi:hypothetical protein
MKIPALWYMVPCSLMQLHQHFGATHSLHIKGSLPTSYTLKLEDVCCSETSAIIDQTRRHYVPAENNVRGTLMAFDAVTNIPCGIVEDCSSFGEMHSLCLQDNTASLASVLGSYSSILKMKYVNVKLCPCLTMPRGLIYGGVDV